MSDPTKDGFSRDRDTELKRLGFDRPNFALRAALRWWYAELHDSDNQAKTIAELARIIKEEIVRSGELGEP